MGGGNDGERRRRREGRGVKEIGGQEVGGSQTFEGCLELVTAGRQTDISSSRPSLTYWRGEKMTEEEEEEGEEFRSGLLRRRRWLVKEVGQDREGE
jgi:hypothetical protein